MHNATGFSTRTINVQPDGVNKVTFIRVGEMGAGTSERLDRAETEKLRDTLTNILKSHDDAVEAAKPKPIERDTAAEIRALPVGTEFIVDAIWAVTRYIRDAGDTYRIVGQEWRKLSISGTFNGKNGVKVLKEAPKPEPVTYDNITTVLAMPEGTVFAVPSHSDKRYVRLAGEFYREENGSRGMSIGFAFGRTALHGVEVVTPAPRDTYAEVKALALDTVFVHEGFRNHDAPYIRDVGDKYRNVGDVNVYRISHFTGKGGIRVVHPKP